MDRILEDNVVNGAYCKVKGLGCGLKDLVSEASSIDDFVEIARSIDSEAAPPTWVTRMRSEPTPRRSMRMSRWVKEDPELANRMLAADSSEAQDPVCGLLAPVPSTLNPPAQFRRCGA